MNKAYPLSWPDWPRHKPPYQTSQFKTSLSKSLANVQKSVEMFSKDSGKKVTAFLISSNVTLGSQRPNDPGVAVYFTWDDINTCIAVDRYQKVEDNLQAIHHCIEAERTKLRHGGLNLVRASFRGYAALPPPSGEDDSWWSVLGVSEDSPHAVVEKAYQKLRSQTHPDRQGNAGQFHVIQSAYKRYQKVDSNA